MRKEGVTIEIYQKEEQKKATGACSASGWSQESVMGVLGEGPIRLLRSMVCVRAFDRGLGLSVLGLKFRGVGLEA